MTALKNPNLPSGRVRTVLLGEQAGENIHGALRERGITILSVPADDRLDPPVRCHADMLVHPLGGREVVVPRTSGKPDGFIRRLEERGFEIVRADGCLSREYPADIRLDAARVGSFLFCVPRATDPVILRYCRSHGIEIVPVKQGYAKCSVCVVDETSIITSDPSIAQAGARIGLSVCSVRKGAVRLDGYEYGFIGGCSGKLGPDTLVFTGDLHTHPDGNAILEFLRMHGIQALSLCSGPLVDVGGILPLEEETISVSAQ